MARRISKKFCVVFKRSESEKRVWNMSKELDSYKAELDMLKKELEGLKSLGEVDIPEEEETQEIQEKPGKKTKKKKSAS